MQITITIYTVANDISTGEEEPLHTAFGFVQPIISVTQFILTL